MEPVSGRNPLEIPEILENILECLPMKDLKASRLVNKFWRDAAIEPMKKKKNVEVGLGYPNDKTINDLADFVECLNSVPEGIGNFPCSKIFVDASLIRQNKKNRSKDKLLFANLLQKISPCVTELGLSTDLCKIITTNAFPMSLNFSKLKVLQLNPRGRNIPQSWVPVVNFYEFVASILERAASLRKVDFIDDGHSVDAILKAWKPSFTEMKIYGAISNTSLEKLSKPECEMKLKSLDLSFHKSEVNNTSLFQFLKSQNDSLEEMILYFFVPEISSSMMVSFPEMPKLKNLTILLYGNDDDEDEGNRVTFPVISYQRQFPALKTLHLNPWDCHAMSQCKQFINQEMQPFGTLDELTLPRGDNDEESLLIAQNAVRIFPNVKKLKVAADPVMLPTIFEHWTNLERLTLYYNRVPSRLHSSVNRVLIGHTRSEYKKLQKRIKKEGQNFDWNRLEPGNAKESIVNLQKLRVLEFENAVERVKLEVDRAPFHLILRRISSLRCVDFLYRRYPMEAKIDKSWLAGRNEDCVVLWNHQDFEK